MLLLRRFWYVIPILLLAIALAATSARLADVKEDRENLRIWRGLVVAELRTAAGNPKLEAKDAPAQVAALGRSVGALKSGLERCNASALAAAENDRQAKIRAQGALQAALARETARQATIDRLRSSAAQPRSSAAACEPSETVKEVWK